MQNKLLTNYIELIIMGKIKVYDDVLDSYKASEIASDLYNLQCDPTQKQEIEAAKYWFAEVSDDGRYVEEEKPKYSRYICNIPNTDMELYYDYGADYYFAVVNDSELKGFEDEKKIKNMVTINNFEKIWGELKNASFIPEVTKENVDKLIIKDLDLYDVQGAEEFTRAVDQIIADVNKAIENNGWQPSSAQKASQSSPKTKSASNKTATKKKASAKTTPTRKKTAKKATTKKVTAQPNAFAPSVELKYIKRYIGLHNKTYGVACARATTLLRALQKSISLREIRKTSKYADEIMNIQRNLIKIIANENKFSDTDKVVIDTFDNYKALCKAQVIYDISTICKTYASNVYKEVSIDFARKMLSKLNDLGKFTERDKYEQVITAMKNNLQLRISGSTELLMPVEHPLSGLFGTLAGI